MKKSFLLLFFLSIFINAEAQQTPRSHPEKGILPFNAPCKTCTEEIEKRTGNTREFIALNADGSKTIYKQQSLGNMNFKDKDGFWRTKDPRVIEQSKNIYAARMQPSPVVIDFENKCASIANGGKEFRFSKNISLIHIAADGTTVSLGSGNWTNMTRSENYIETIFLIRDFYPGIDLQMIANAGSIKTNFIIRNRLKLNDGWLVMRQQVEVPADLHVDLSQSVSLRENMHTGIFTISNEAGVPYFIFGKSDAYDAKERTENYMEMPFALNGNQLDYFVTADWLNSSSTQYPVTLDPFVYSSDTIPEASITGSGWTPVCGTQGCSYFLDSVMTPANCEITNIDAYFSYIASVPCVREDGGFDITMTTTAGTCVTPNFYCGGGFQGQCYFWPAALMAINPPVTPCLLPPQCAPYPLNFELKFRRCNWVPVVPCDATCIRANSDWTMTIEGRTAEITNITANSTICEGDAIQLCANADWGVPPYTYTWSPSALTGPCQTFNPSVTTHFQVTINDSCGSVDTASTDVIVISSQNPGFTITPGDTVCDGTPVVFSASGNAPANNYDWTISCPADVDYNDTQILNYSAPGAAANCTATLHFEVDSIAHTCSFSSSQNFVVEFCSGINEFTANDPVSSIYPNPANSQVTIVFARSNVAKNILLSSVLGELKFNETDFDGDGITLDLAGLAKGIYFAKVSGGDQISIHKIILY